MKNSQSRTGEQETPQRTCFIEAARELGTNDDPAAFDALFSKLLPPILPEKAEDQASSRSTIATKLPKE